MIYQVQYHTVPTEISQSVQVDTTTLNLHSGPSVIDHAWAKGKKVFWKGRKVGQLKKKKIKRIIIVRLKYIYIHHLSVLLQI